MKHEIKSVEDSPVFSELKNSREYELLSKTSFNDKSLKISNWKDKEDKTKFYILMVGTLGFLLTTCSVFYDLKNPQFQLLPLTLLGIGLIILCIFFAMYFQHRFSIDDELNEDQYKMLQKQMYFHQPSRVYILQKLDQCGKVTVRDAFYLRLDLNVFYIKRLIEIEENLLNISKVKESLFSNKKDPN